MLGGGTTRCATIGAVCRVCGAVRAKGVRGWRWLYPDIAPIGGGILRPIACFCVACAAGKSVAELHAIAGA